MERKGRKVGVKNNRKRREEKRKEDKSSIGKEKLGRGEKEGFF